VDSKTSFKIVFIHISHDLWCGDRLLKETLFPDYQDNFHCPNEAYQRVGLLGPDLQSNEGRQGTRSITACNSQFGRQIVTFYNHRELMVLKSVPEETSFWVIVQRKVEWKQKRDSNSNRSSKKRQALPDLLLDIAQDGSVLCDEDILEEVNTFIHDNSQHTLDALCSRMETLLKEYDDVIGTAEITL
ncbi:hypothetical protein X777_13794, partial [Ooceraea biroi]